MRRIDCLSLAAFVLLAASGFGFSATAATPADDDFVMKAANGGKMEVELGRLAAKKARNGAVKSFGRRMVVDHTKAGNKLKILASRKHITLPSDLDAEGHEAMQRLSALSGSEFDRAYMEMMVNDHDKDVAEFETESKSSSDADVKAFAARTLPTLRIHLRLARAAAQKVK